MYLQSKQKTRFLCRLIISYFMHCLNSVLKIFMTHISRIYHNHNVFFFVHFLYCTVQNFIILIIIIIIVLTAAIQILLLHLIFFIPCMYVVRVFNNILFADATHMYTIMIQKKMMILLVQIIYSYYFN